MHAAGAADPQRRVRVAAHLAVEDLDLALLEDRDRQARGTRSGVLRGDVVVDDLHVVQGETRSLPGLGANAAALGHLRRVDAVVVHRQAAQDELAVVAGERGDPPGDPVALHDPPTGDGETLDGDAGALADDPERPPEMVRIDHGGFRSVAAHDEPPVVPAAHQQPAVCEAEIHPLAVDPLLDADLVESGACPADGIDRGLDGGVVAVRSDGEDDRLGPHGNE